MVTCCRNCTERHIRCHSTCETYIQERAQRDAEIKANIDSKVMYMYSMSRKTRIKER